MTTTPSSAGSPAGPQDPAGQPSSGQTPPPAYQQAPAYQPPPGPRVTSAEVRDLARLRRTVVDRKVAGVAGGIARHLDIDPLIVRVAFVVLSLFGGAGLIVYAACWILLPEDGQLQQPLGLDERSRSVALILVGILGVALLVGQWDWFWVPGPLILVALVVWLVMSRRNDSSAPVAPVAPPPGVPNAGPDAVTPEQRWASAASSVPSYDVPVEQQAGSEPTAHYQQPDLPAVGLPAACSPDVPHAVPAPHPAEPPQARPEAVLVHHGPGCPGRRRRQHRRRLRRARRGLDLPGRRRRRGRRDAAGRRVLRAGRWADLRRPAGRGGHRDRGRVGERRLRPRRVDTPPRPTWCSTTTTTGGASTCST